MQAPAELGETEEALGYGALEGAIPRVDSHLLPCVPPMLTINSRLPLVLFTDAISTAAVLRVPWTEHSPWAEKMG
jgi:hypothetical protein